MFYVYLCGMYLLLFKTYKYEGHEEGLRDPEPVRDY